MSSDNKISIIHNDEVGQKWTFNDANYLDVIGTSYCRVEQSHVVLKMSTNNFNGLANCKR